MRQTLVRNNWRGIGHRADAVSSLRAFANLGGICCSPPFAGLRRFQFQEFLSVIDQHTCPTDPTHRRGAAFSLVCLTVIVISFIAGPACSPPPQGSDQTA